MDLVKTILSAPKLTEKMHFGMAHFADGTEYWQSKSWGASNLATSGQFVRTVRGDIILVGDIVRVHAEEGFSKGRVIYIGTDGDEVWIRLEPVLRKHEIANKDMLKAAGHIPHYELIIWEDNAFVVQPHQVKAHLDVHIDREWNGEKEEVGGTVNAPFFIKRAYNEKESFRPIRKIPALRGDIEVEHFGREQICSLAAPPDDSYDVRSFPIILFIDDFGVHRNMYRALKAFYWIPAAFPYSERRKLANVFTFTLAPHGHSIQDVVDTFKNAFAKLAGGVMMTINGRETLVCAYVIVLIGDMPQQADTAGFLRHSAKYGCRSCRCKKAERADLEKAFTKRYHWDTIYDRQHADRWLQGAKKKKFLKERGMRMEPPPLVKLCPALDLILGRPYDVPHSEWRGLGRILQSLLMREILTKAGADAYLKAFQSFRFPPGWSRIQSPLHYIWSWSLTEAGRATILTPLILRSHSQSGWFRLRFIQEFQKLKSLGDNNNGFTNLIDQVIRAFAMIAECNHITGRQLHFPASAIREYLLAARQQYQALLQAAHNAHSPARDIADAEEDDREENINEDVNQLLDEMALEDDDEEEEDEEEDDVKEVEAAFISVSETASESEQAVATSKSKYIRL